MVIGSRAAHVHPSNGHDLRAVPQSYRSYDALNPESISPLPSSLNGRVFRGGTRKMGPASRLAGQQPANQNFQFSNEVPA